MDRKSNSDMVKELIQSKGDSVGMHEPVCVIWKADHENCIGCPSELGCDKMVKMLATMMIPMMYSPKNFEDYQSMIHHIESLNNRILDAKTLEELNLIPLQ